MKKELSEVVRLEIEAAQIKLIQTKEFWTRGEMMLALGIKPNRMTDIDKAKAGPDYMKIGGGLVVVADSARYWFNHVLPKSEWSRSKQIKGTQV